MKKILIISFGLTLSLISCSKSDKGNEPWTQDQLIEPSELARILKDTTEKQPITLDIGFFGGIKNSVRIGPAREKQNLDKLRDFLNRTPKDAEIVIYCGCCPFKDCPNIRPAFSLLKEMNFTNAKLLDLPHNLKSDWSDKGYPPAR